MLSCLIAVTIIAGCGSESARLHPRGSELTKYGDYYLKQKPADGPRALRLFERGAAVGDKWGQYRAAELLNTGEFGIPKDEKKAAYYYNLSSQQGNKWASLRLAQAYQYGKGVPANQEEALRLAKLAYSQSDGSNKYINMLLYDLLKDSQPDEANKYLLAADKAGNERAHKIVLEKGKAN